MSKTNTKKRDVDYLAVSSRIHALETKLLTGERMERMIEAKELREAARVLTECGYSELSELTAPALEAELSRAQGELFRDLDAAVVEPALLDVFRCRFDYHNVKVLVKPRRWGRTGTICCWAAAGMTRRRWRRTTAGGACPAAAICCAPLRPGPRRP